MKKFLIAVICFIPIVVVLALSTASRIIISAGPVNARSISIRGSNNQELDLNEVITMNVEDTKEFVIVELFPTITDQKIIYELDSGGTDTGNLTLSQVDDTSKYTIVPIESGVVRVIVRAKNNHSVYKSFTVHILEKTLKEIIIYNADGNIVSELMLNSTQQLFCDIIPITALAGNSVVWSSDNQEIAGVMPNGTVYPVAPGKTQIRVTATDTMGNSITASVPVDTTRALVKSSYLYASHAVDAVWVYANGVVNKGAKVVHKKDNIYSVSLDGAESQITVLPCEGDDWGLREVPQILYTNNGPFFMRVGYLETGNANTIDAKFYVDDAGKARVEGDVLKPLSTGQVKLYVAYGGEVKEYPIEVRSRPLYFDLNMNKEDGMLGIKMDRLFAINWLDENKEQVNTYQFGAKLKADDADLLWEISDPESAEISSDAKITFNENALGKRIIVTATAMAGNYRTKMSRSFGFHIAAEPNAINAYNTEEFYYIVDTLKGSPTVLQDNIKLQRTAHLSAGIYGNGFTADGSEFVNLVRNAPGLYLEGNSIPSDVTEIIIEDIIVEMADDYISSPGQGQCVSLHRVAVPATVKNLIARYANESLVIDKCEDVLIEGCILGETYFTALTILSRPENESTIILRNNIIRKTEGPTVLVFTSPIYQELFNKNIMPTLRIEGFYDVYNWKTEEEIKNMMSAMDPTILNEFSQYVDPKQLFSMIGEGVRSMFTRKEMDNIAYIDPDTKDKYYCVGALVLGLFQTIDIEKLTIEDEGLSCHKLDLPSGDGSQIGTIVAIIEGLARIIAPEMTIMHSNYVITYDMKPGEGPRNKPGDPVPQTKELYERLNQYYAVNIEIEEE
ncbi:MAG: Ig-like domain-containing protein [Clostridia bacterium]